MAFKIRKYKGKHTIKDTKTGKSVEVDMEKLMSGGYSFDEGGEFDCPPNDLDCLERKRQAQRMTALRSLGMSGDLTSVNEFMNPDLGMTAPQVNSSDPVVNTEDNYRPQVDPITITPRGPQINVNNGIDDISLSQSDMELVSSRNTPYSINTPDIDYSIFNPYAGVDIPSAANYLGRSISNDDALGTAVSGLKVASGLARNLFSGMGAQNRYNQVLEDYYKEQRDNKNPIQYLAYGGKKDKELATGEFIRGVENEDTENFNAEVESGEYIKTNEGDIAEIVGKKHSEGGEKIQMEEEDRILSDQLKLGGKTARELSKKFDLKLKAAHTYADVLDKYKKKSKLNKLVQEEADILEKIDQQQNVEDKTTRDFNLQVLKQKRNEVIRKKDPIEEKRKEMFDELFDLQEASKKPNQKQKDLAYGGKLETLAKEYGIPLDRAKELVQKYSNGGKFDEGGPGKGKKVSRKEAEKKVAEGAWRDLGDGQYIEEGTDNVIVVSDVEKPSYIDAWNSGDVDKSRYPTYEDFRKAAELWNERNPSSTTVIEGSPDKYFYAENEVVSGLGLPSPSAPAKPQNPALDVRLSDSDLSRRPSVTEVGDDFNPDDLVIDNEDESLRTSAAGLYLFPDETPLPPSALQGSIKPEARFDRVRSTEIDVEPYLQSIRDREEAQISSLEGLSPNVRAAVMANVRANAQREESDIRNRIDTANLASEEKAQYTNAELQRQEQILNNNYRQGYEARVYRAQALTDQETNDYYNQLQNINKQRFMDIHNLNLINQSNEDVAYVPGQGYVRKTSDKELMNELYNNI